MTMVSLFGESSGNDITNPLNHRSDFRRDNATRLWGYMGAPLTMIILTSQVQPTARCPYLISVIIIYNLYHFCYTFSIACVYFLMFM